jgi:hypothetical protein
MFHSKALPKFTQIGIFVLGMYRLATLPRRQVPIKRILLGKDSLNKKGGKNESSRIVVLKGFGENHLSAETLLISCRVYYAVECEKKTLARSQQNACAFVSSAAEKFFWEKTTKNVPKNTNY